MALRDLLRELRSQAGFSAADVASKLGMSIDGYRGWEQGYAQPSPERLARIARAFDVPLVDLARRFGLEDEIPPPSDDLTTHLASLVGPESGRTLVEALRVLSAMPKPDQVQVIAAITDLVEGRRSRMARAVVPS
jgi:transcriptional regulator with XRE-family HTH domain